ncbi:toxin YoeB [Lentilactobacillus sunkii]|jgi:toxin YoeB|uniref:Endoribonuclease YoeB n=1 Tax=Lentilactobacillus sunkii TaxID=481719 RepID=A0A1E7X8B0_9LACO|nr:Txe/YoeB family addiction module toxin [Lentilactobacillus sunkii]OFA09329.1 toxin YoeB [Lentilactobacillus sunkii]
MKITWTETAWDDYLYIQNHDRTKLKRTNQLIKDIIRNGNQGIGKPEKLHANLSGWYSRRIDSTNRLVYKVSDDQVIIAQARTHYHKK